MGKKLWGIVAVVFVSALIGGCGDEAEFKGFCDASVCAGPEYGESGQ